MPRSKGTLARCIACWSCCAIPTTSSPRANGTSPGAPNGRVDDQEARCSHAAPDLMGTPAQQHSHGPYGYTPQHREQCHQKHRDKTEQIRGLQDRKSTRLNSSHVAISYAVFCVKKKNELIVRRIEPKRVHDDERSAVDGE